MKKKLLAITLLAAGATLTSVAEPAGEFEASIIGEVKSQGKSHFKPGSTLMDLWKFSGGATDKADPQSATLVRDGREINVQLETLSGTRLQPGDILLVARGKRLGVTGQVCDPGIFPVSGRSRNPIQDAIQAAGGLKKNAAIHRIQLCRPTLPKPIPLNLSGPDAKQVTLQDGDTLFVPPLRCVVIGRVSKPGQFLLQGDDTLDQICASAGTASKGLKQIVVFRAANVEAGNDERETYSIESSDIPKIPIRDGDVVLVPDDAQRFRLPLFSSPPFYYDRVFFAI